MDHQDLMNVGSTKSSAVLCYSVFGLADHTLVQDDTKTFKIVKVCEALGGKAFVKAHADVIEHMNSLGNQGLNHIQLAEVGDRMSHWIIERFNRCLQLYMCECELAGQVRSEVLRPFGLKTAERAYYAHKNRRIRLSAVDRYKADENREKMRLLASSQPNATPSVPDIRQFLQELDEDDEGRGPAAAAAAAAPAAAAVLVAASAPAAADGPAAAAAAPAAAAEGGVVVGEVAEGEGGMEEIVAGMGGANVDGGDGIVQEGEGGEGN